MTENPSTPQRAIEGWSDLRWSGLFAALTIATLLVHGYHPLAEDGGLYVAGVELTLNRSLFPHFTEFVSEHMHYSIFAPVVASHHASSRIFLCSACFCSSSCSASS